jgi:hypothetical protein
MRNNRAALGHVQAPETRVSNLNKLQKSAEYGSTIIVVFFLQTIRYVRFQLPYATGVEPGATRRSAHRPAHQ